MFFAYGLMPVLYLLFSCFGHYLMKLDTAQLWMVKLEDDTCRRIVKAHIFSLFISWIILRTVWILGHASFPHSRWYSKLL